jgi:hypothetical protein
MRDHECLIRAFGGCVCPPGECAEKPATPAPVILISARTQMAVCLTIGVIAGIAAFATAARMEPNFKTQDLIAQENVRHG